jgi:hypothetical protein
MSNNKQYLILSLFTFGREKPMCFHLLISILKIFAKET